MIIRVKGLNVAGFKKMLTCIPFRKKRSSSESVTIAVTADS